MTVLSFLCQCINEQEEMAKFWKSHPYLRYLFASGIAGMGRILPSTDSESAGKGNYQASNRVSVEYCPE
jgi:hypothetical protein